MSIEFKKTLYYVEKVTKILEIAIAILLLVVVTIKIIGIISELAGFQAFVLAMEFERILSVTLNLVIGVEFTRMLIKHTPESVLDVLLFATARQMVVYHERTLDLLIGVIAIVGLFATKKYLSGVSFTKNGVDEDVS